MIVFLYGIAMCRSRQVRRYLRSRRYCSRSQQKMRCVQPIAQFQEVVVVDRARWLECDECGFDVTAERTKPGWFGPLQFVFSVPDLYHDSVCHRFANGRAQGKPRCPGLDDTDPRMSTTYNFGLQPGLRFMQLRQAPEDDSDDWNCSCWQNRIIKDWFILPSLQSTTTQI